MSCVKLIESSRFGRFEDMRELLAEGVDIEFKNEVQFLRRLCCVVQSGAGGGGKIMRAYFQFSRRIYALLSCVRTCVVVVVVACADLLRMCRF